MNYLLAALFSLILIQLPTEINYLQKQKPQIKECTGNYIEVNYSLPSTEKRLFVKHCGKIVYKTYVAHGKNSGGLYAKNFSNKPGSLQSSLGNMKVGQPYYGKHGISYKLIGLNKGLNDNVFNRSIVIHSSYYIGYGKTGRSEGCLAIPIQDYKQLLKYIKPGMRVFAHR